MNYFNPYPVQVDVVIAAAWNAQLAEAAESPPLAQLLDRSGSDLFSHFVKIYAELRALPRGARRALQRRLAHSRELSALLQEWLEQQAGHDLQHKLARTLAGAALLLTLGQNVHAANITVNTNKPDVNLVDGKCSLIEAIVSANTDTNFDACVRVGGAGADTIILPAGNNILTQINNGVNGLPLITTPITIEGNGATISRKKGPTLFRLMQVSASGNLTLNNVKLSGGSSPLGGGAIYSQGPLTINNSTITGNIAVYGGGGLLAYGNTTIQNSFFTKNTARYGGAVYINNTGNVTITNSTVSGNKATNLVNEAYGGGISNYGTLNVQNSTITKNIASGPLFGGYGGGVINFGTATIADSTISSNTASSESDEGDGGGIFNFDSSTLTVQNSIITKNKASSINDLGGGGGIYNSGTANITGSTLSLNTASSNTFNARGGGISSCGCVGASLTIDNSNITKNTAKTSDPPNVSLGGGVINEGDTTITNSTISGNKAEYGAGIYNDAGTMNIQNSTISGNIANFDGGGIFNDANLTLGNVTFTKNKGQFGGGIFNQDATAILTLNRTLISGNKGTFGAEVYNNVGAAVTANNFNLFGAKGISGTNFVPGATDIVPGTAFPTTKVLSASLADNGGPTPTHALVAGSPAIDAVLAGSPATDQRGVARPQGVRGDIGAFEGPP